MNNNLVTTQSALKHDTTEKDRCMKVPDNLHKVTPKIELPLNPNMSTLSKSNKLEVTKLKSGC